MSQISDTTIGKQAQPVFPEHSAEPINTPVGPVFQGPENSARQTAVCSVFPSPFRGTEKTGRQTADRLWQRACERARNKPRFMRDAWRLTTADEPKAIRAVLCAILEQAVADWRDLQAAGFPLPRSLADAAHLRHPVSGVISVAAIMAHAPGQRLPARLEAEEVRALLLLLLTPELDRLCGYLAGAIRPAGVRRALQISAAASERK